MSEYTIATYLTIEFKKNNHMLEQVQNQATTILAMWLYYYVSSAKNSL